MASVLACVSAIVHIKWRRTETEPKNLVFLKTYKTDFDDILITFTDQNGRPLEK